MRISGKKKLGILGGMGPEATAMMFQKIISLTSAIKDQDHIEIFIHSNTNIPDRSEAILNGGESPIEELCRSAIILSKMGSDVIIIPCMTSHYFFDEIQKSTDVMLINAIEECVGFILNVYPGVKKVGILSTSGTMKTGLFQKQLEKKKLFPLLLSRSDQEILVMDAIYGKMGIKAGNKTDCVKKKLIDAAEKLIWRGAEVIIAGCTEIPLVLETDDLSVPIIDPLEVLSFAAIKACLGEMRIKKLYHPT